MCWARTSFMEGHNLYLVIFRFLRLLLRIFGPKRDQVTGEWRSCTMRNFIICSHPKISLARSSQGEWVGRGMWHAWKRRANCARFWWVSPKERDRSEDQGVGGKMGPEWIFWRLAWGVWIGFDWLRIGIGGGLLWVRLLTFGFLSHGVSYGCYYEDEKPSRILCSLLDADRRFSGAYCSHNQAEYNV
jgi:hypothetical protein